MEKSDAVIVLMSKHSDKSSTVRRDVQFALSSPKMEGRVIPVVVGRPSGSWALRRLPSVKVSNAGAIAEAGKKIAEFISNKR